MAQPSYADALTAQFRSLNIGRTPTPPEVARLVAKREKQRERGRQLAAQNPMTEQKLTVLLWAKAHRQELNNYKVQAGGRQVTTAKRSRRLLCQKTRRRTTPPGCQRRS